MSPKPVYPHTAQLELYEKLVATQPGIQRKGAANPYTSLNGHMFSFLTKDGKLAIRLPADEREKFIHQHRTRLAVSYNTVMKEYVEVPATLFKQTNQLKKYLAMSISYIRSLPPKPTTRKKASAPKKKAATNSHKRKSETGNRRVPKKHK